MFYEPRRISWFSILVDGKKTNIRVNEERVTIQKYKILVISSEIEARMLCPLSTSSYIHGLKLNRQNKSTIS